MLDFVFDIRLAMILARALSNDRLFEFFFAKNILGHFARYAFFRDEIQFRRKFGLVLTDGCSVALVGLPPRQYIGEEDLRGVTKLCILLQGRKFSTRWKAIFAERRHDSHVVRQFIYLSAIASQQNERRNGRATRLLSEVKSFAKDRALDVECEISSDYLFHWYTARQFSLESQVEFAPGIQVQILCHRSYCLTPETT